MYGQTWRTRFCTEEVEVLVQEMGSAKVALNAMQDPLSLGRI
jgi:hypothetical protein